jgi:hypothetical protein
MTANEIEWRPSEAHTRREPEARSENKIGGERKERLHKQDDRGPLPALIPTPDQDRTKTGGGLSARKTNPPTKLRPDAGSSRWQRRQSPIGETQVGQLGWDDETKLATGPKINQYRW